MAGSTWNGRYDALLDSGDGYEDDTIKSTGTPTRRLTADGRAGFCAAIEEYGPPTEIAPSIDAFLTKNNIPASVIGSPSGWQWLLVNVLAVHKEYSFNREDLTNIKRAMQSWYKAHPEHKPRPGPKSLENDGDVIQHVNKSGQWGLRHQNVALANRPGDFYRLCPPFEYDGSARKLQKEGSMANEDKEAEVQKIKDYMKKNWLDVPADQWDQGHASPSDAAPSVYQPRGYQRPLKARFKFDEHGLALCPTSPELAAKLDKYYPGREERAEILRAILASSPGILEEAITLRQSKDGSNT